MIDRVLSSCLTAVCGSTGEAVVHFARNLHTGELCAIKFFLSEAAFHREVSLYQDGPLRRFLPKLFNICGPDGDYGVGNQSPTLVDPNRNRLPPCIVVQKGDPLGDLVGRPGPGMDLLDSLQVRIERPADECFVSSQRIVLHGRNQRGR